MFEALVDTRFLEIVQNSSSAYIYADRQRYASVYKIIETYCADKKLILSNICKLLSVPDNATTIMAPCKRINIGSPYIVYGANFNQARALTDLIYKYDTSKSIRMLTRIKNTEFTIEYDGRKIVDIYNLMIGSIDVDMLFNPVIIENLHYLPAEIEIISLYHKLYLPNYAAEWKILIEMEPLLLDIVFKRIGIIGAKERRHKKKSRPIKTISRSNVIKRSISLLINAATDLSNKWILIGLAAVNIVVFSDIANINKVQIISPNSIERDVTYIQDLFSQDAFGPIEWKEHKLHLSSDFRIRRTTIYITNKNIPIIDIFNSAQFELIPALLINKPLDISINETVRKYKAYIGNAFVLLRFIMIDIWTLRIINRLGKLNKDIMKALIDELFDLIQIIQDPKKGFIQSAIDIDEYIGINIEYKIAKTLNSLKQIGYNAPYIPLKN